MSTISISKFKEVLEHAPKDGSVDFINVCTPAEYKEQHIPGVRNVPLDTLPSAVEELKTKETIYIHCRSGKRGAQAQSTMQSLGVQATIINVEGGLMAWEEAGHETKSHTSRIPIMRQVLITAGGLVLGGTVLGYMLDERWLLIPAFVGSGLLFAGISGWCGMSYLLARMPWNK